MEKVLLVLTEFKEIDCDLHTVVLYRFDGKKNLRSSFLPGLIAAIFAQSNSKLAYNTG